MPFDIVLILFGGLALYFGGDWLVDGTRAAAARLRISPALLAVFVMGFGTSAPELFVSVGAVLDGADDIAMGNIVGSNIANLLFILALVAVLVPIPVSREVLRLDGGAMLASGAVLIAVSLGGRIGPMEGVALIALMAAYLALRLRADAPEGEMAGGMTTGRAMLVLAAGLAALLAGSEAFVAGASGLARSLGISEAAIGMTIVAIGTSLPELASCLVATVRREGGMALAGILGSNVFNSTIVAGAAALFGGLAVAPAFSDSLLWVMAVGSLATFAMLRTGLRLDRVEGSVLLAGYAAVLVHVL